ncbi:hypothetical protein ACFSQ7_29425 [Paenibacillus rhizoplanae]
MPYACPLGNAVHADRLKSALGEQLAGSFKNPLYIRIGGLGRSGRLWVAELTAGTVQHRCLAFFHENPFQKRIDTTDNCP